jgi:quinol monooxygenase YgiN
MADGGTDISERLLLAGDGPAKREAHDSIGLPIIVSEASRQPELVFGTRPAPPMAASSAVLSRFEDLTLATGAHMPSTHVHMTMEWYVPLGQTRHITLALHSIAAETRMAHGCVACSVTTDLSNRGTVRYTEKWLTEQDLRTQMQSETFGRLIMLIEDASEPPRIEFALPNQTRGYDFVAEVRAATR